MSFDHKAFEFSWPDFTSELLPVLSQALQANEPEALRDFVVQNLGSCKSPYSGAPLAADWQTLLEVGDLQELADFALTKYYDPTEDFGLSGEWATIEDQLPSSAKEALLGIGAESSLGSV